MVIKCTVTRCDWQENGFCKIVPTISDETFDVQMSDEVIGEGFPVCQSIHTEIKEKKRNDARYKEISDDFKKRYKLD